MSKLDEWIQELRPEECPFRTRLPHEWNEKSELVEVWIGDELIWKKDNVKTESTRRIK